MTFKEHRINKKFSSNFFDEDNKNYLFNIISSIQELNEIYINDFLALKYKNKVLFFNIISMEKDLLLNMNLPKDKFKRKAKKYKELLEMLAKYYRINKDDIKKISKNLIESELCIIKNENIGG